MNTRRIVAVSAGLSQPSSTRMLADRLSAATADALREHGQDATVEVVELRDLAHDITDMMLTGFPSVRLSTVIDAVKGADALVAVTPVFTASYSGLFKSFFDVLDSKSLVGKPTLLGATAGTPRHSLVLEHALRPMFAYLRADVVPTAVFAATDDWGDSDAEGAALPGRVRRAAGELATRVAGYSPGPDLTDPFASLVPFDQHLSR